MSERKMDFFAANLAIPLIMGVVVPVVGFFGGWLFVWGLIAESWFKKSK